ncbi:MAG: hypothetical protein C4288_04375 [Leptolyngbya sp. ERB_1_1]
MGNRTIPLQNVTASRSTNRAAERKPIAKPSNLPFILQFAKRHPFVCLLAVWSSFLFFGWLAISGLTYINPAPLEVVESPHPETTSESPLELSKPNNTFGLLAIVTVSCAATSVLLARQLRPTKRKPRPTIKPQAVASNQAARSTRSRPSSAKPIQQINQPVNVKPGTKPVIAPKPPTRPIVVTVLTVEDENPLEMGDVTLAEMLDIRQQVKR